MLRDVSGRDQGVTLFGQRYDAPFGIPPLGGSAFVAYRGDLVLAEAAQRQSLPMVLSASALISLEDVHARNPDAWFQAYLPGDQTRIDRLVRRVDAAGYRVLVVTADTPMLGNREHNIRTGFSMPIRVTPRVMWQSVTHPRWALGVVARTFLRHGAPHFENTEAERRPPDDVGQQRPQHDRAGQAVVAKRRGDSPAVDGAARYQRACCRPRMRVWRGSWARTG